MARPLTHAETGRREDWREWKPISDERLLQLIRHTVPDHPNESYTADEVYRLAAELRLRRSTDPAH